MMAGEIKKDQALGKGEATKYLFGREKESTLMVRISRIVIVKGTRISQLVLFKVELNPAGSSPAPRPRR